MSLCTLSTPCVLDWIGKGKTHGERRGRWRQQPDPSERCTRSRVRTSCDVNDTCITKVLEYSSRIHFVSYSSAVIYSRTAVCCTCIQSTLRVCTLCCIIVAQPAASSLARIRQLHHVYEYLFPVQVLWLLLYKSERYLYFHLTASVQGRLVDPKCVCVMCPRVTLSAGYSSRWVVPSPCF